MTFSVTTGEVLIVNEVVFSHEIFWRQESNNKSLTVQTQVFKYCALVTRSPLP